MTTPATPLHDRADVTGKVRGILSFGIDDRNGHEHDEQSGNQTDGRPECAHYHLTLVPPLAKELTRGFCSQK